MTLLLMLAWVPASSAFQTEPAPSGAADKPPEAPASPAGASAGKATASTGIPGAPKWQLDIAFHDPQRITFAPPGTSEPKTYWYFLYTVTNNTGQHVAFYPSITLVTQTLQTVQAGDNVHPTVYDQIKARHEKEYPFFAPPAKVTGPLLQGSANSRTTAAVFENFDPQANEFTIFASGLSGEIQRLTNPSFNSKQRESEENPPFFVLRRTLAVTYRLPGDEQTRRLATPVRLKREWVMR